MICGCSSIARCCERSVFPRPLVSRIRVHRTQLLLRNRHVQRRSTCKTYTDSYYSDTRTVLRRLNRSTLRLRVSRATRARCAPSAPNVRDQEYDRDRDQGRVRVRDHESMGRDCSEMCLAVAVAYEWAAGARECVVAATVAPAVSAVVAAAWPSTAG